MPDQALEALGASRKQAVTVRVSEYCYRSTVAIRFGGGTIPLSAAHRDAPGLEAGDMVDVTIELDSEPRTVRAPDDLAASLAARVDLRAAFDSLAPSERGACVNTRTTSHGAQSTPGLTPIHRSSTSSL